MTHGEIAGPEGAAHRFADLGPQALGRLLVGSTISAGKTTGVEDQALVFGEYARRALPPDMRVFDLRMNETAAALNSVSAIGTLATGKEVFLKVHVEGEQVAPRSALGAQGEYRGGQLLAESGWPTVVPLYQSDRDDYPLLVYPAFSRDQQVLFDVIQSGYAAADTARLRSLLPALQHFHNVVGQAQVRSLTSEASVTASRTAPLQIFFGRRLDPGARADQWFTPEREFNLPGIEEPITWTDLKDKTWLINGEPYNVTLARVLEKARKELLFDREDRNSYLVIAHGDDHPGNIVVGSEPDSTKVFDPVAAGRGPAGMANAKALAHATILPMAGMYYDPKCQEVRYQIVGDQVVVDYDFASTPLAAMHEVVAQQIIHGRILPVFEAIQRAGADINQETQTLRSALAMCALLTVDTARLLAGSDNRGQGLLPATILLSQMRGGLPSLDRLNDRLAYLGNNTII